MAELTRPASVSERTSAQEGSEQNALRSLVVAMSESSVGMLERRTREQCLGDLMIVTCQADTEYELRLKHPSA